MVTDLIGYRRLLMRAAGFLAVSVLLITFVNVCEADSGTEIFERRIRPLLIEYCYECHSEQAGTRKGGLLFDRERGWLQGGNTGKAVVPGEPQSSLLIAAIRHTSDTLLMPPDVQLTGPQIELLTT
ncbi:MAG: hypothetical protein P8K08_08130 [Fuerstiella sp.]|nr:hypothetical protein [Fuerstiella sp.]